MNYRLLIPVIKSQVSIPDYYRLKGLSFPSDVQNRGGLFSCQIHGPDLSPSAVYNKDSGTMKCFSCGFFGDVLNVVKALENFQNIGQSIDFILRNFSIDLSKLPDEAAKKSPVFSIQNRDSLVQCAKDALWSYVDKTGDLSILIKFDRMFMSLTEDDLDDTYSKIKSFMELCNADNL